MWSERCEVLVQQLFDTAAELVQGSEWDGTSGRGGRENLGIFI